MPHIETYSEEIFERIKRINDYGAEYWSARELAKILEYRDYRNFLLTTDKAMQSCKNSGQEISDHFGESTAMVDIGSGAKRQFEDYHLSRYACYLIVQNRAKPLPGPDSKRAFFRLPCSRSTSRSSQ